MGRNVERFRGGLVVKAHRLVYHSTLGLRVIKKKKEKTVQKMFRESSENVWPVSERSRELTARMSE